MAKILHFRTPQDNIIESLEYILDQAKQGNITTFACAANLTDGNVATSYSNADLVEKMALIGHMQVDVMYKVIESNMDRLVEFV